MGGDTKEAMGLVNLSEDMAALNPGKTISDAMEALADAKNGEFERLKGFQFKVSAEEFKGYVGKGKNDDLSASETKTAYQTLINTKLSPYYKGGAAKLADSGTGLASTVLGKTGTVIQDTGIKMLEKLKPSMRELIGMIDRYTPQMNAFGLKIADGIGYAVSKLPALKQWLKDAFEAARPTLEWLTTTGLPAAGDAIVGVWDSAKGIFNFIKDNWSLIAPIVGGITAGLLAYKAITLVAKEVQLAYNAVMLAFNLIMAANPFAIAAVAVGLLIAGGIALYQNWDTVKKKAGELWDGIKSVFSSIGGWFDENVIKPLSGMVPNWLKKIFSGGSASANVTVTTEAGVAINGDHATGLNYVPFDGYIAKLHKGERVQTARENPFNGGGNSPRSGNTPRGAVVNLYGTTIREEADIPKIAHAIVLELDAAAANTP
jgi:hypothetical protein